MTNEKKIKLKKMDMYDIYTRKMKEKTHQSCDSYVINRFIPIDYRRKTCSPKMHFSLWRWCILVTPGSCEM